MDTAMKRLILFAAATTLLGCAFAAENGRGADVPSYPATQSYSQRDLLKNWALSRCLAAVTNDKETKDDGQATAAAYLEFGKQPIEAYEELDALVEKFAQRKYSGSIPSKFNTMKCIDLFHSKELETVIAKWVK